MEDDEGEGQHRSSSKSWYAASIAVLMFHAIALASSTGYILLQKATGEEKQDYEASIGEALSTETQSVECPLQTTMLDVWSVLSVPINYQYPNPRKFIDSMARLT